MASETLREQGNTLFKEGHFLKAAAVYTKAIQEDPENATLYSNRCAALIKLNKLTKAMTDADKCIELKPQWEKGYFRKGCILEALGKNDEALQAFKLAADTNPENAEVAGKVKNLKRLLTKSAQQSGTSGGGGSAATASTTTADGKAAASDKDKDKGRDALAAGDGASDERTAERTLALRFMDAQVKFVLASLQGGVESPKPLAVFLVAGEGGQTEEKGANLEMAFESPDTQAECQAFLRNHAESIKACAGCLIAPRASVSFPQVWKRPGWQHGAGEGVFVQLESPIVRKMVYLTKGKKGWSTYDISIDEYQLMAPLFRTPEKA
eukprot:jgi/Mesvir1/17071/Mv15258-RA.1